MKERDMSESEAFEAMRKMAMNKGKSMAEVSQSIIAVMELLA